MQNLFQPQTLHALRAGLEIPAAAQRSASQSLLWSLIDTLRRTPRTGFVDHGVRWPETVWEHCLDTRNLARRYGHLALRPAQVERLVFIMPWHDITEALVPDITPTMGISRDEKASMEGRAIDAIGKLSYRGAEIREAFLEFEESSTPVGAFGKLIDTYAMTPRLVVYERQNAAPYSLQPFWDYIAKKLNGTPLQGPFEGLLARRPKGAAAKPVLERPPLAPDALDRLRRETAHKIACFEALAT